MNGKLLAAVGFILFENKGIQLFSFNSFFPKMFQVLFGGTNMYFSIKCKCNFQLFLGGGEAYISS